MRRLLAAAVTAAALVLAGCSSESEGPAAVVVVPSNTSGFLGTTLDQPLPKPDVTLTATRGEKFNVARDTKGEVTALYIGYTHCPDVCPTTMADLSVAMNSLPPDVAENVKVVFITTDPGRDTSKAIGRWLNSFAWDGITGLTGPFPDIKKAADSVGIFIDPPVKNPDGTITVEHGAQVILFGKDDQSDLIFTSGFDAADVAHDLQRLEAQ
ncbi:MAG: SCO family protein [Micrococcales bacterium]|nr:SCO family protein [Micrococcales bacterium]